MSLFDKFSLGTAQIGLAYGVANQKGKMSEKDLIDIFKLCELHKITQIDTALSYGTAHLRLARHLNGRERITTKISFSNQDLSDKNIFRQFDICLNQLSLNRCDTLLVHDTHKLSQSEVVRIWEALSKLRELKKIQNLGFSCYDEKDLDVISRVCVPDTIQLPLNICDSIAWESKSALRLRNVFGTQFQVRSVFMQGLFFLDPHRLPSHLKQFRGGLAGLRGFCDKEQVSILDLALAYVLNKNPYAFVIGVDSALHFKQVVDCLIRFEKEGVPDFDPAFLSTLFPKTLSDPRNWRKN